MGVTHTCMQKLGAFRPCRHVVAVQTSGIALEGRASTRCSLSQSHETSPLYFTRYSVPYKHAWKISVRLDTRCIYYHFLRENREKRVSRHDATSVRTPIPLKFGVGDSGGHSHTHAKVGCVSSILTCSCSTNLRYRFGGTGIH